MPEIVSEWIACCSAEAPWGVGEPRPACGGASENLFTEPWERTVVRVVTDGREICCAVEMTGGARVEDMGEGAASRVVARQGVLCLALPSSTAAVVGRSPEPLARPPSERPRTSCEARVGAPSVRWWACSGGAARCRERRRWGDMQSQDASGLPQQGHGIFNSVNEVLQQLVEGQSKFNCVKQDERDIY